MSVMGLEGLSGALGRINQIQALLQGPTVTGTAGATTAATTTSSASGSSFASALDDALGTTDSAATGAAAVADARKYLGVPYLWGGTTANGFDCSGLVQKVYADLGVNLPRVAADQARAGTAVPSLAQARPGDLVAFGSPVDHIGIYVGNGQMIAAPRTGDVVKVQPVYETPTAIRRVVAGSSPAGSGAPAGVARYTSLFAAATSEYGLPQGLLAAVATAESGGTASAVSPAGAQGLMQLMPGTARSLGVNAFDPAQAVDGAARLLSGYLARYGSVPLALAAYNAGPGAVDRYHGVPPYAETQDYVARITRMMGAQS